MRILGLASLVSVLAGALALAAACGTGSRAEHAEAAPRLSLSEEGLAADTFEASAAADKGGAATDSGATSRLPSSAELPAQRMVIKTATLSVRVRDVAASFARAVQLAEAAGGYVQSTSQESSGGERADLTIRVPPEGFLPLIRSLEALGAVDSKGISGEDVTEEYFDLDARLENLSEVRGRLFRLLEKATKVTEAVEVERELERVGGEINQIKGRMRYLETMVGLSTIDLALYSEERPTAEPFINWSLIRHGFVVAARALVRAFFYLLQALVVLIPLAVVLGGAGFGIWRLVRFLRGRRPTRSPHPPSRHA